MKRENILSFLLLLCFCLGLSACGAAPVERDETNSLYQSAPLPSSDGIDWNDVSGNWTGRGGRAATDYFDPGVCEIPETMPFDMTYKDEVGDDGVSRYYSETIFTGLKNEALTDTLNREFAEQVESRMADTSFFDKYATDEVKAMRDGYISQSIYSSVYFCGNIISIMIEQSDSIFVWDEKNGDTLVDRSKWDCYTDCYDMSTGEKVTLADLFVDGTDIGAVLNPIISRELLDYGGEPVRSFRGLPKDYPYFFLDDSALVIILPESNPYATSSRMVSVPTEEICQYMAQPVSRSAEFMQDNINFDFAYRNTERYAQDIDRENRLMYMYGNEDMGFTPYLLRDKEKGEIADKINENLKKLYTDVAEMDYPEEWLTGVENWSYRGTYSDLYSYRAFVHVLVEASVEAGADSYRYMMYHRNYSLSTGELIPLSALISDREGAETYLSSLGVSINMDEFYNFQTYDPSGIYLWVDDSGRSIQLPEEYINTEYFK